MVINQFGDTATPPSGTILLWNEPLSNIPAGWVLCDGNNGTPNLLDEFPMSVPNNSTDPGGTGGTHSTTLTTSQIPSHSHSTSMDNSGRHRHGFGKSHETDDFGGDVISVGDYGDHTSDSFAYEYNTSSVGDHTHGGSTNNTGSASSIENRPSYHEVAFIMKS